MVRLLRIVMPQIRRMMMIITKKKVTVDNDEKYKLYASSYMSYVEVECPTVMG